MAFNGEIKLETVNNGKANLDFILPTLPCKCLKILSVSDKLQFVVEVDSSKITSADTGAYSITAVLNSQVQETKLISIKTFNLKIVYHEAPKTNAAGPSTPSASQMDFLNKLAYHFNDSKKTNSALKQAENPTRIWIDDIDSNGKILIKFDRNITVPKNVKNYLKLHQERSLS